GADARDGGGRGNVSGDDRRQERGAQRASGAITNYREIADVDDGAGFGEHRPAAGEPGVDANDAFAGHRSHPCTNGRGLHPASSSETRGGKPASSKLTMSSFWMWPRQTRWLAQCSASRVAFAARDGVACARAA